MTQVHGTIVFPQRYPLFFQWKGAGLVAQLGSLPAGEVWHLTTVPPSLSLEWGHPHPPVDSPGTKANEGTPALPKYVYKQKQGQLVRLKMKPGTGAFLRQPWKGGWGAGHHFAALINDAAN